MLFPIKGHRRTQSAHNASGKSRTRKYRAPRTKPLTAFIEHRRAKVLLNAAIATGPNGPYSWILKHTERPGTSPLVTLAAAPVTTQQELGTLHVNLDYYTGDGSVVAAGEFLKSGATALFNLQSGSYMVPYFPKGEVPATLDATLAGLQALAAGAFTTIGLVPTYNKAPAGSDHATLDGGLSILETMGILTTISEMDNLDRLLSVSSNSSSE